MDYNPEAPFDLEKSFKDGKENDRETAHAVAKPAREAFSETHDHDILSIHASLAEIGRTLLHEEKHRLIQPLIMACLNRAVFNETLDGEAAAGQTYVDLLAETQAHKEDLLAQTALLAKSAATMTSATAGLASFVRSSMIRNDATRKRRALLAWRQATVQARNTRRVMDGLLSTLGGRYILQNSFAQWHSFTYTSKLKRRALTAEEMKLQLRESESKKRSLDDATAAAHAAVQLAQRNVEKLRTKNSALSQRMHEVSMAVDSSTENWTRLLASAWYTTFSAAMHTSIDECNSMLQGLIIPRPCCTSSHPLVNPYVLLSSHEWESVCAAPDALIPERSLSAQAQRALDILKALPIDILVLRWANYQLQSHERRTDETLLLNFSSDFASSAAFAKLLACMSSSLWATSTRSCAAPTGPCKNFPVFGTELLNDDPMCAAAEVLERLHRIGAPIGLSSPELIVSGCSDTNLALVAYLMCSYPSLLLSRTPEAQSALDLLASDGLKWQPGVSCQQQTDHTATHISTTSMTSPMSHARAPHATLRSPIRQRMIDCGELASKEIPGMLPLNLTDAEHVASYHEVYAATIHSLTCSSTKHRHSGCELVQQAALSDTTPSIPYEDQAVLSSTTWKRVLHVLTAVSDDWENAKKLLATAPERVCVQAVGTLAASVKAVRDVLCQASRCRNDNNQLWTQLRYHVEGTVWAMMRQRLEVGPTQLIDRRDIAITEAFTVLSASRFGRLRHDISLDAVRIQDVLSQYYLQLRGIVENATTTEGPDAWVLHWPQFYNILHAWKLLQSDSTRLGIKTEESHASRAIQAATLLTEPQCRSIFIRSCHHRTGRLNRGISKPTLPQAPTVVVATSFDNIAQLVPQHAMAPSDFVEALLRITTTICYNAYETITTTRERHMLVKSSAAYDLCCELASVCPKPTPGSSDATPPECTSSMLDTVLKHVFEVSSGSHPPESMQMTPGPSLTASLMKYTADVTRTLQRFVDDDLKRKQAKRGAAATDSATSHMISTAQLLRFFGTRPDLGIVGSVLPAEMLLIIQQSRGRAEEMHLERLNANWNKKLFALAEDVLGCSTAAPKRTTRGKGPSLQKSTQLSYMEAFQLEWSRFWIIFEVPHDIRQAEPSHPGSEHKATESKQPNVI